MTRTAVVFLLIIPIAASSAIIADKVAAVASPVSAIISSPTEHTQVIASNLERVKLLSRMPLIIPLSSLTGMKAPLNPPT